MEVNIDEIVSTVHAVDSDSLLSPATLNKIVRIVLDAVNDQESHRSRVNAEQRITGGIREEMNRG